MTLYSTLVLDRTPNPTLVHELLLTECVVLFRFWSTHGIGKTIHFLANFTIQFISQEASTTCTCQMNYINKSNVNAISKTAWRWDHTRNYLRRLLSVSSFAHVWCHFDPGICKYQLAIQHLVFRPVFQILVFKRETALLFITQTNKSTDVP